MKSKAASPANDSILDTRFSPFFFPSPSPSSTSFDPPAPAPSASAAAGRRNWVKGNFLILEQLLPEDGEGGRKNGIELLRAEGGRNRTNGEENG